jgi:hypothetical protein
LSNQDKQPYLNRLPYLGEGLGGRDKKTSPFQVPLLIHQLSRIELKKDLQARPMDKLNYSHVRKEEKKTQVTQCFDAFSATPQQIAASWTQPG